VLLDVGAGPGGRERPFEGEMYVRRFARCHCMALVDLPEAAATDYLEVVVTHPPGRKAPGGDGRGGDGQQQCVGGRRVTVDRRLDARAAGDKVVAGRHLTHGAVRGRQVFAVAHQGVHPLTPDMYIITLPPHVLLVGRLGVSRCTWIFVFCFVGGECKLSSSVQWDEGMHNTGGCDCPCVLLE